MQQSQTYLHVLLMLRGGTSHATTTTMLCYCHIKTNTRIQNVSDLIEVYSGIPFFKIPKSF